ncbi:MAG: beta-ketoacyl-ACP synthase III [Chloroflexota bacterium]
MSSIYGRIAGWGHYTPEKVLTNFDLEQMVDTSNEWIVQRSGIRERRIAQAGETTSTMAVNAGRSALEKAGLSPADLDLIIVATSTPDYHAPAVSSLVQDQLGAVGCPAFVVETGCTGWVYGLSIAYQFIQTGTYENILVIGVELLSRFVNWKDRSTCVLFGDAAGAAVIQATEKPCGLEGFELGSDGSQGEAIILPAGGSARPSPKEPPGSDGHYIRMNGREVFKFATRTVGASAERVLQKSGMTLNDIDWIIPHQANLRIIQAASKMMDVPLERFIINLERYGNTSAATIPVALSECLTSGQIQPTDRLLLASFGAGLTWATAIIQPNHSADHATTES